MLPPPAATKPKTPIALARSAGSVKSVIISESDNGRGDRAADTLHRARSEQELLARREPADERREGEERDPDQEQPPVAEQVAEPPAEEQTAAICEQVGVHDPRE